MAPSMTLLSNDSNDMTRTDALAQYGLKIVRFKNEDVFSDIDKVVETIESELGRNRN